MTFNDSFNSVTLPFLMQKVMDTVTKTNVLGGMMLTNGKAWKGRTLDKAIQISAPTTGGSFAGLDTFDTTQSQTKVRASFDVRAYRQTIVVPGLERDIAGGDPNAAVDYVVEAIEEGANAMAQSIGTIFYGDGTGNSSKEFLGLKANVDDGTVVDSFGGLSRTSYASWRSYRSATGAGLTTFTPIYTAINATEQYGVELGNKVILTTRALWTTMEGLMTPTVHSNVQSDGYKMVTRNGTAVANRDGLKGEVGFNAFYVRGIPVIADDKCTTNYLYVLNTDFINWYGVQGTPDGYRSISMGGNKEIEGLYGDKGAKDIGAIFTNFIKPVNQYGEIGHIILRGNLATFNPNRHAVLIFS